MPHPFEYEYLNSLEKNTLEIWKTAKDFKALFVLNMVYIDGSLQIHPAHPCPLQLESEAISEHLKRLNAYGLFTFQGQPMTTDQDNTICQPDPSGEGAKAHESERCKNWTNGYSCRSCAYWWEVKPDQWVEVRQLPYIQFCVPYGYSASLEQLLSFCHGLLSVSFLHVQISWPKNVEMADAKLKARLVKADIETASYIPQKDLEMFHHFKSPGTSSCTYESRYASKEENLKNAEFAPTPGIWSEVNDYHLMTPRLPQWFLGPDVPTVVFGVSMTEHGLPIQLEKILICIAQEAGFRRRLNDSDVVVPHYHPD